MSKRTFLVLAILALLLPVTGFGQMRGGQGAGTATTVVGIVNLQQMAAGMGIAMGHDLTIGPDGTAYVLDPDLTILTSPKTAVIAISPRSGKASEWKSTVEGLVHEIAAGSDKLVVSASQGVMGLGLGMVGGSLAPLKSKLYVLNAADGALARTIEHDGVVTSLAVRKVDTTEYIYLVTREQPAVLQRGMPAGPKVKLSIYRMDGSTVKSVNLTSDEIVEIEL